LRRRRVQQLGRVRSRRRGRLSDAGGVAAGARPRRRQGARRGLHRAREAGRQVAAVAADDREYDVRPPPVRTVGLPPGTGIGHDCRGRAAPALVCAAPRREGRDPPMTTTIVRDFPHAVRVIENVWVPLPDGTRLAAKIWLPDDAATQPAPAVFEFLPYRKGDGTAARDEVMYRYL